MKLKYQYYRNGKPVNYKVELERLKKKILAEPDKDIKQLSQDLVKQFIAECELKRVKD